eukprot:gnl/TRDRNA2_/TRDRNA2_171316_c3_seq5.p1 gnl/TRDRNA2_/TRDRNA2_171316_c3~~gnl/TRDRNA2_/TRDRNA2_171316_c3_seq5.p1  ORF type:complete len:729 (-),score=139.55 gnl/TRDRNA2_/TRDRNA2_171316_c3_seq5:79-2265(-)
MISYDEDWLIKLLLQNTGSIILRACVFAVPSACLGVALIFIDDETNEGELRTDLGMFQLGNSVLYGASTAVMVALIMFRTNKAYARFWEGTGLLHQMRGEWFDTVSNCITFSITARKEKPKEVNEFRHTIVRLMSLCHGSALEEIAGDNIKLETVDVFGLDIDTIRHLKECHEKYKFNKVEIMLHLLQSLIVDAHTNNVLKIAPPILSRVFQTISRGFVNLLNAKKITDTQFPFPYAQLIAFLLLLHTILVPCIVTAIVKSKILAFIFIFLPILGLFGLNYVAAELENPFGDDDNDLEVQEMQAKMNCRLLLLLRPMANRLPQLSSTCKFSEEDFFIEHRRRNTMTSFQQVWLNLDSIKRESVHSDVSDSDIVLEVQEGPPAARQCAASDISRRASGQNVMVEEPPVHHAGRLDSPHLEEPQRRRLEPAAAAEVRRSPAKSRSSSIGGHETAAGEEDSTSTQPPPTPSAQGAAQEELGAARCAVQREEGVEEGDDDEEDDEDDSLSADDSGRPLEDQSTEYVHTDSAIGPSASKGVQQQVTAEHGNWARRRLEEEEATRARRAEVEARQRRLAEEEEEDARRLMAAADSSDSGVAEEARRKRLDWEERGRKHGDHWHSAAEASLPQACAQSASQRRQQSKVPVERAQVADATDAAPKCEAALLPRARSSSPSVRRPPPLKESQSRGRGGSSAVTGAISRMEGPRSSSAPTRPHSEGSLRDVFLLETGR